MKKFIKKILLSVTVIAVAFGFTFAFAPVTAIAETGEETPEISAESSEILTDGATVEEEPETGESVENSGNKTGGKITIDDLLTIVGTIAEREGVDEWQETVDNIRLAVSAKKLDVAIALEIVKLCVIVLYLSVKGINRIRKNIEAKKNPSTVSEDVQSIKQSSTAQTKAVNEQTKAIKELAETDGQVAKTVAKENEKLNALAAAQVGTNEAIRCLIRGIGMNGTVKDEAYRALNNSNENCDKIQK